MVQLQGVPKHTGPAQRRMNEQVLRRMGDNPAEVDKTSQDCNIEWRMGS